MSSNMLSIPFRRTHNVELADALRRYIETKYDQHPEMFAEDLRAIEKLRREATGSVEAHPSRIAAIASYAAQLVWVGGKFPIDVGVEFAWYPSLGYNTDIAVVESNLRFELANVLFNLAALYSQLALAVNRNASEGLKAASNYFCQAAGIFEYLKTEIIPDMRTSPPGDMDLMTLESLQQLMLAQAQECSWWVARNNGYKDLLVSKLAAKLADLYQAAAENGTRSDTISTDWIHHMSAKHHHFASVAQYRAAMDCLERRKYGEEVARLKDSLNCVNEALKESKYVNKAVQADMQGLKSRVTEDLKGAERDNDFVYNQTVPSKSELKTLDRAEMAVAKPPKDISNPSNSLGEKGIYGEPLFVRLVPHSVHVAASIYADRRDRIISNDIIDELEALTDQVRDMLQSLNLPGALQAIEKPLGVPASVTSHAEEIRQQGGVHTLKRSLRDIENLRDDDIATFEEGISHLQTEATEDERARMKYGTDRWRRATSQQEAPELWRKKTEIEGFLNAAAQSDELVKSKLKENEDIIRVLEGSQRDLENYVPSSRKAALSPRVEQEATKLRGILNEISRMESRRRKKAESLRDKAKADDINSVLLAEAGRLERDYPMQRIEAAQFEDLFAKRLQRYDEDAAAVVAEREDQDHLVTRLRNDNQAFVAARGASDAGGAGGREREQALQKLEGAYLRFKETLVNLDNARTFYNGLAKIVTVFREDCKKFRYRRRMELGQLEDDLSNAMSNFSISQASSLQDQREREVLRTQFNTQPPNQSQQQQIPLQPSAAGVAQQHPQPQPPLITTQNIPGSNGIAAPTPTRATAAPPPTTAVWSPDMGIKFGAGAAPGPGGGALPPPAQGPGAQQQQQQQQPLQGAPGNVHRAMYPNAKAGQWTPDMGLKFS